MIVSGQILGIWHKTERRVFGSPRGAKISWTKAILTWNCKTFSVPLSGLRHLAARVACSVPDSLQYKDQLDEINLTGRIHALRIAGSQGLFRRWRRTGGGG